MTESQATAKGLTQIWVSRGSKAQDKLAFTICDDLRSKGVTAEVIPVEEGFLRGSNAVWRDKKFEERLIEEEA